MHTQCVVKPLEIVSSAIVNIHYRPKPAEQQRRYFFTTNAIENEASCFGGVHKNCLE